MIGSQVIIYMEDDVLRFLIPATLEISIDKIAEKDVPAGVPYKIVDASNLPTDRTFRDAWQADMTDPDGVGADYGTGSTNKVVDWDDEGNAVIEAEE